LDFGTLSSKKTEEKKTTSTSTTSANQWAKRRKAPGKIETNAQEDCKLSEKSKVTTKVDTRYIYVICKTQHGNLLMKRAGLRIQIAKALKEGRSSVELEQLLEIEDKKVTKPKQTRFWCQTHKAPVCALHCYDAHRNSFEDRRVKSKKTKKSTSS